MELTLEAEDGSVLPGDAERAAGTPTCTTWRCPRAATCCGSHRAAAGPTGYALSAAPASGADWDAEPNDAPTQALAVAIGTPVAGRLAGPRDLDQYAFTVPPELAGHQLDVGITSGASADRQVCVIRLADAVSRCRAGTGDITLSNELLAPGDYRCRWTGTRTSRRLHARGHGRRAGRGGPRGGAERHRADGVPVRPGRHDARSVRQRRPRLYRLPIAGEAQVWRLDATGDGIRSVTWVQPDGQVRGTADISADGTRASLWDMALVPGDHWIAIETRGEDYTLTMTPLGPRAEGAEREPNNDRANAEPIELDVPRTGRVPGPADTDVYRFSLGTAEQITVRLDPPATRPSASRSRRARRTWRACASRSRASRGSAGWRCRPATTR